MKIASSLAFLALTPAMVFAHGDHEHPPAAKAVSNVPVVAGSGDLTYKTVPTWGILPDEKNLGPTHGGVVVDKDGNVYTSTDADHAIVVFNPDGTFKKAIAPECKGTHALAIGETDGTQYIYGAHLKGQRIVKLDLDGKVLMEITADAIGDIQGGFKGLTSIAVSTDGHIYASTGYGSQKIFKFDASGKLLKVAGERGKPEDGPMKFRTCHGLLWDDRDKENPKLLVMDRENNRLVHLTPDLEWIGVHTTDLRRPCSGSIHGDYVALAELSGRASIIGKDGKLVVALGDNPDKKQWNNFNVKPEDMSPGIFTAPHGISYDATGNLYVQDWNATGRITKLELQKEAQ